MGERWQSGVGWLADYSMSGPGGSRGLKKVLTGQHLLLGGQGGSSRGGLRWTMDGERDPVRLRGAWKASPSQLKRVKVEVKRPGRCPFYFGGTAMGGPGWSLVCVAELKSGGTQACSVGRLGWGRPGFWIV